MPLPWQHTFCHCQKKMCLTLLHPKANIYAKFHENWWKTEEVVRDARFPPILAIICRYHGNTLSATVEKCVLHIYTSRHTSALNSWQLVKNWGRSLWRKICNRPTDRPTIDTLIPIPRFTLCVCGGYNKQNPNWSRNDREVAFFFIFFFINLHN